MIEFDEFDEPDWANHSPVDVYVKINITKIFDIDTINQRFQAEAVIESRWHDPTITSRTQTIDEKKIWKPDIYIDNGVKDIKEDIKYKIVPSTEQGKFMIYEMRKISGLFHENLELQDFPLDIQELSMVISTRKPGKIVNLILLENTKKATKIHSTLDASMWKVHHTLRINATEISNCERTYPALKVRTKVSRIAGYFFWNAFLPVFLVTIASLTPFVVDIKMPQSRLPATCTLILTSVSLRWSVGRLLPTVSYLTSLDKYSLGSMLVITLELIYHGIMGAVFPKIRSDLAYLLDTVAFEIFAVAIFTIQVGLAGWVFKKLRLRQKIMHALKNGEDDHWDSIRDKRHKRSHKDNDTEVNEAMVTSKAYQKESDLI